MGYTNTARSSRSVVRRRGALRGLGEVTVDDSMYSPGAVIEALDRVNRAVNSLNTDIRLNARRIQCGTDAPATGPCTPTAEGGRFILEWTPFVSEWARFYNANHSGTGAMTMADYAVGILQGHIREKAQTYNQFERRYTALAGRAPTGSGHAYVSWGDWFSGLGQTGMMWAGIGIVGMLAVGYIMASVAKIKGASRLVLNRRNRRRR